MTTLKLALTQEIRLDNLDNGPGLLPFKLGPARVTTHHHTFLQYIDLDRIEHEINELRGQLLSFEHRLFSTTYTVYEPQIRYLMNKTNHILEHLQTLEPSRTKRGFIDGLGSLVKSETGNLDYQDAIRYNKALEVLENNQNKINSELSNRASLNKEWMKEQSSVLERLVQNQIEINNTLQSWSEKDSYRENSFHRYGRFTQTLIIITENANGVLNGLINIENKLAFTRTTTTHHSMISLKVLRLMLSKLRLVYGPEQVVDLELRDYYALIKSGLYFVNKQIVIFFKFPIVSKSTYDLYRLSLAPNRSHRVIIPPSPFLAINRKEFVYIEAKCPKYLHLSLCDETSHRRIRTTSDCIQQIILSQTIEETCIFSTVHLLKETVEQLDDRSYIISFPKAAKVRLSCGTGAYNVLNGSFLVTLPLHCSLQSPEFTILNADDAIQGQPLKIMKIEQRINTAIQGTPPLNLTSVDLKALHSIQEKASLRTPLQMDSLDKSYYYHTTLPFYVVLSGVIIFVVISLIRRYKLRRSVNIEEAIDSNEEKHTEDAGDHTLTTPSQTTIFSHKIGK
ncbi:unnamed protein product [Arctia plantaginis]|uniref:Uncharacterized protein n=1 Tax=Arctia plantaginis TaxID=874455 RepID=A0A8S0ZB12_ARCPL|nr:unnamed protein product [Arctia plantaginis]